MCLCDNTQVVGRSVGPNRHGAGLCCGSAALWHKHRESWDSDSPWRKMGWIRKRKQTQTKSSHPICLIFNYLITGSCRFYLDNPSTKPTCLTLQVCQVLLHKCTADAIIIAIGESTKTLGANAAVKGSYLSLASRPTSGLFVKKAMLTTNLNGDSPCSAYSRMNDIPSKSV